MTFQEAIIGAPNGLWERFATGLHLPALHLNASGFPWAVLIALVVMLLAFGIKHFANSVIEDGHAYVGVITAFLIVYAVAAFAIGTLTHAASAAF